VNPILGVHLCKSTEILAISPFTHFHYLQELQQNQWFPGILLQIAATRYTKVPAFGEPDSLLQPFENLRVQSELVVAGLIGGPMSRCLITSFTAADLKDCG
jgi:hypothetical protein